MKKVVKKIYFLIFSVYKYVKYPSCKIQTNFVLPGVNLGYKVWIRKYCKINRGVSIGSFTFINEYTLVDSNTKSIGKFCSISHNVKIGMGPHPISYFSTSPIFYSKVRGYVDEEKYDEFRDKGYTVIGNDVFIGCNVVILAGVSVGDGAVIAAGSIVVKDVPPYAIVGGNPAKIIKYRFDDDTVAKLLKMKWWDYEPEKILNFTNNIHDIHLFLEDFENKTTL